MAEAATAREDAEEQRERALSLLATCGRYGVVHPFGGDKDRLQQSFVDHPDCWNKDGHADSLDRWAADPCYTLRPARVGRGRHAVAEQTPSDDSFTCGGAGRLAAPPGRD